MNSVLLNGKIVDEKEIDPAKHKFVGPFRPPSIDHLIGTGFILCDGCRHVIQTQEQVFDHWRLGHFDMLQYVNI